MCESKVYLVGKAKEKIMDEAVTVRESSGRVTVTGIMGERREVQNARITEVNADTHEIYLKKISDEE